MDKELQRQTLLVQLKILKELRLLNKNFSNYRSHNIKLILSSQELDDVKQAIAMTGRICI